MTACGSGSETDVDSEGRESVKVRTDVYFSGATLPLVAGVQEGIFEKHGLSVDLKEGTGSATTIQTVANGSDDIGYADAASMVQSVARGVDVQMVAGMVQESPLAIFALEKSDIKAPKDLEGKTAGYTPGSAAERLFPAYAEAAGIEAEAVSFRNVDIPTRTQLLLSGKTDFTFGLLNVSLPNLKLACECEPVVFPYTDAGVQTLSSGIFAGEDFLEDRPETAKKFLAALEEAVDFANNNTDAAVKAFLAFDKDTQLEPSQIAEQWQRSMELHHTEANKEEPFGCMAPDDWATTIDQMEKYGDVAADSVDVTDAATNEFLPETCGDTLADS